MIPNMDREKRVGTTDKPNISGSSIRERKTEREDLNGKMVATMKVTLLTEFSKERVYIYFGN